MKSQSTILYFMQLKQSQQLHFIQTATLRRVLYRGLARLTKTLPVRMPSQARRIETEFEFENDTKVERHKLLHSTHSSMFPFLQSMEFAFFLIKHTENRKLCCFLSNHSGFHRPTNRSCTCIGYFVDCG